MGLPGSLDTSNSRVKWTSALAVHVELFGLSIGNRVHYGTVRIVRDWPPPVRGLRKEHRDEGQSATTTEGTLSPIDAGDAPQWFEKTASSEPLTSVRYRRPLAASVVV